MTQALTTRTEPSLTVSQVLPLDRNPATVYLARLVSSHSRRTMQKCLNNLADSLGVQPVMIAPVAKPDNMGRPSLDQNVTYLYVQWADLRYSHTTALRTRLMDSYPPATVNKHLAALRGVLKECWRLEQMTAEDYMRAVDVGNVKGETLPAGRDISSGEMLALVDACGRDTDRNGQPKKIAIRDSAIIGVLYTCGLRRAECAALERADVDPDSGKIEIKRGKGRKARTVYASNGALEALGDWLALRGDEPGAVFQPVNKGDRIQRRAMTTQAIYNLLKTRGLQAGLADFSPHDFRRTFVGDMLARGVDIVTVQKIAGHEDVKTTARYDRRGEKVKQDAAAKLHFPYKRWPKLV